MYDVQLTAAVHICFHISFCYSVGDFGSGRQFKQFIALLLIFQHISIKLSVHLGKTESILNILASSHKLSEVDSLLSSVIMLV